MSFDPLVPRPIDLPTPIDEPERIGELACSLLDRGLRDRPGALRLVGVGVSGLTVYNWEAGTARPRASHLAAIAALRSMGKKEAAARLRDLRPPAAAT